MATVNKAFRVKNGLAVDTGSILPYAGTTTIAPIVFTSGTNLTTASAGSMEFDGTNFYLTPSTTRKTIAFLDSNITGSAGSVTNSLVLKADTGTTEGTDLYTFNGAAGKTLNIVGGSGVTITKTSGQWSIAATNAGTVTSVTGTSPVVSSGGSTPAISLASGYGDTQNPYASKTANYFLSAPNGSAGVPVFRAIVSADIPTLNQNTTGSAGSVANALTIGSGLSGSSYNGSAAVTVALATAYGDTTNPYGSKTANYVLAAPNGSAGAPVFRALVASDIPTIAAAAGTLTGTTLNSGVTASSLTSVGTLTGLTMGGNIVMATNKITGLGDPTAAQDAATKYYVDTIATGVNAHEAVSYASTAGITGTYNNGTSGVGATLTGTGSLVIDGYTVVAGDAGTNVQGGTGMRLLLKDQTLTDQNGIYTVTACVSGTSWTITRAYDYDVLGEVAAGDFTYVLLGSVNSKFSFVETSKPTAISGVGTTANAITFGIFANGNISGLVNPNQGGTGVNNGSNTITLGGTLQHAGAFAQIFRATAATDVTLPTTGTLATLAGSETLANKTLTTPVLGVATATSINGTSIPSSKTLVVTTDIGTSVQAYDADLGAIAALTGTSGFLKTNGSGTWSVDTATYLTSSTGVTTVNGSSGAITNVALTTGKLSQFAATTSSELAGVVSDETGTGALVFAGSPALTGTVTVNSIAGLVTATGSGSTLFTMSSIFDKTVYNGGEFIVKLTDGTDFEIIKVLTVIKGTTVYVTQYADVVSNVSLGTIDFTLSTNNVNMTVTPSSGTVTAKVTGTLIAA
jgi:hypothetical protein